MERLNRAFFNRPTLLVAKDLLGKFIAREYRGKRLLGMITETEAYIGPGDRAAHSFLLPEKAPQKWHSKFHELLVPHVKNPREAFEAWAKTGAKITKRNIPEYLEGGHTYIYLVYGMYWQLNFSTGGFGVPECVLIRAVVPAREKGKNFELMMNEKKKADGPGKLCTYFKLDGSFWGEDAAGPKRSRRAAGPERKRGATLLKRRLWLEDRGYRLKGGQIHPPKFSRGKLWRVKRGPRIGVEYAGPLWSKKPWRFTLSHFDKNLGG